MMFETVMYSGQGKKTKLSVSSYFDIFGLGVILG